MVRLVMLTILSKMDGQQPTSNVTVVPTGSSLPSFFNRLGRAFSRYRQKTGTFFVLSLFTSVIPLILGLSGAVLAARFGAPENVGYTTSLALLALMLIPAGLVLFIGTAAIAIAAAYKARVLKALKAAMSRGPMLMAIGILSSLILTLPMLIIIPGVILSTRFSLAIPVAIIERRKRSDALARSAVLVKGHTFRLLLNLIALQLLIILPLGILAQLLGGVGLAVASMLGLPSFLVAIVAPTLAIAIGALLLPIPILFLQIFYEDLVKRGDPGLPTPSVKRLYILLAVMGFLVSMGGLVTGGILLNRGTTPAPQIPLVSNDGPSNNDSSTPEPEPEPLICRSDEIKTADTDGTEYCAPKPPPTAEDRDWLRYGDINAIRIALASHRTDEGVYPTDLSSLVPIYMSELPVDPVTENVYSYVLSQGNYTLSFTLEAGVLALAQGDHILSPRGFDLPNLEPTSPIEESDTIVETIPSDDPIETDDDTIFPESPETLDTDNDGLTDAEELILGTDSTSPDTDSDRLSDRDEVYVYHSDPLIVDSDGDGFTDGQEVARGFDPTGEGMLADLDADGLADVYEDDRGFDGGDADMDDDGLADGDEVHIYGTDPRLTDTDADGFSDLEEIYGGYDPAGAGTIEGERAAEIETNTVLFGLHEPTMTNLNR